MKITGAVIVLMVVLLNMLPVGALSDSGMANNAIECHCDAMKDTSNNTTYMISCSTSDKQTQKSQNHIKTIISNMTGLSNPSTSSYRYMVADHFAEGISRTSDTPPPRPLA